MTIEVTDKTFAAEVLSSDVPVLVDFWAEWCPPCHRIAPMLEELATEYSGRARVVKLNADENPVTARAYGVMAMPTLAVFRSGEMVSWHVGARPKVKLREQLDAAL
ncbi:thioredoxin [Dactylosporangium sp. CA-052675]|uniref:thioredoxin n=1 Tax=Dactylosporangium sp. CA-052675 TaxID=3239927 RepID=UPI003D940D5E